MIRGVLMLLAVALPVEAAVRLQVAPLPEGVACRADRLLVKRLEHAPGVQIVDRDPELIAKLTGAKDWRLSLERPTGEVALSRELTGGACDAVAFAASLIIERYLREVEVAGRPPAEADAGAAPLRDAGAMVASRPPAVRVPRLNAGGDDGGLRGVTASATPDAGGFAVRPSREVEDAGRSEVRTAPLVTSEPRTTPPIVTSEPAPRTTTSEPERTTTPPVPERTTTPPVTSEPRITPPLVTSEPAPRTTSEPVRITTPPATTEPRVTPPLVTSEPPSPIDAGALVAQPPGETIDAGALVAQAPPGETIDAGVLERALEAPPPEIHIARWEISAGAVAWVPARTTVRPGAMIDAAIFLDPAWRLSLALALGGVDSTPIMLDNVERGTLSTQPFLAGLRGDRCFEPLQPLRLCGGVFAGARIARGWSEGPFVFHSETRWLARPTAGLGVELAWLPIRAALVKLELLGLVDPIAAQFEIEGVPTASSSLPILEGLLRLSVGFGVDRSGN